MSPEGVAGTAGTAVEPVAGGVRLERGGPDGAVATITLDRPDVLNAQTPLTWAALAAVGRDLPGDVRVVVVTGSGRAFSAGLDKTVFSGAAIGGAPSFLEMASMPAEEAETVIAGYQDAFGWLSRPDLVSVAAVQGHAIGAGFQLALACDLRILAEDASLRMAETSLGLVPDLLGTRPLVELVGLARAMEICLTGRPVRAAEALALGLANQVVPNDGLAGATGTLVDALLAAPRNAVTETKALLQGVAGRTAAEQGAAERAAQVRRLRDLAGVGE